jgi:glycerophosphoryl diester phosphodiesterase
MQFFARRDRPLVIAHRGASGEAPENSLAAFRLAATSGADAAETDVRVSKDGVVVVHHDPELGRTVHGDGPLHARTAHELAALGIPTLEQVLDVVAPLVLCVEIKGGEEIVRRVAPVVAGRNVVFFAFDPEHVEELRREIPDVPVLALFEPEYDANIVATTKRLGAAGIGLAHRAADPAIVEAAHDAGLAVFLWTVNELQDVRRAISLGVDGIITDWPARVCGLLDG